MAEGPEHDNEAMPLDQAAPDPAEAAPALLDGASPMRTVLRNFSDRFDEEIRPLASTEYSVHVDSTGLTHIAQIAAWP